jgi:TatD DNase family protein
MVGGDFPGKPILHWFTGSFAELEEAAANGFFFSVGPAMVRSRRGQELIKRMPSGKVLTESDGPFTRVGAASARPKDMELVIKALAKIWTLDEAAALKTVYATFCNILTRSGDVES